MFNKSFTLFLLFWFSINYIFLTAPILIFLKNFIQNDNNMIVFFGKKKTLILVLLLFFCLSGLPMSNFFLLKWFCFYKLYLSGVYYFVVMFFILNIFFLVFYFFFFKKITLYLNNNNNYAKALSNQYQLILLNLFIIYINIFGFLYINYTYMLVL